MSRMMTLFRSKSGSTSSATSSISFSTEDCVDEIKLDDTCTTPSSPAASEEEINITIPRRHSFTPVAGMESLSAVVLDELQQSVHPHDNDDDLFREVHLKILDLEKENESILQSMIKADEDYEGGETCNNSTDGATSTGSIRQESTRDLFRLKFESNSSTIKSLQLNLPHPH